MRSVKIKRKPLSFTYLLFLLLLAGCSCPDKKLIDTPIPVANINALLKTLVDPQQNIHAVVLASPGKNNKVVVLNQFLSPIPPCFSSAEKLEPRDRIAVEPECTGSDILPLVEEQKTIALTPGVAVDKGQDDTGVLIRSRAEGKHSTFLFITDFDKKQTRACHNPDGSHCPPRY